MKYRFVLVQALVISLILLIIIQAQSTATATSSILPAASSITGPLRIHPGNPRYFTDDSGQIIYLTGSHTWNNLQDMIRNGQVVDFEYNRYLDFLESHNHNFFRLWMFETPYWLHRDAPNTVSPMIYERTGPGQANDGEPKFDLTRFNQAYFDRMRARVEEAQRRGIYVAIMLFQGSSVENKEDWKTNPFNVKNNVNGINGDKNGDGVGYEVHMLKDPAITALQETYVKKVIDTVNDLDNVMYEIANEDDVSAKEWQYHLINFIKSSEAGKPKQHLVGMTALFPYNVEDKVLFDSPADWISPKNGPYIKQPPAATGKKAIIMDTDHLNWTWIVEGDELVQRAWVWKTFLRGMHPIFMDPYSVPIANRNLPTSENPDPFYTAMRQSMQYTMQYAQRVNLAAMTPREDLASSKYCLAYTDPKAAEYLVYLPEGGAVQVDLSAVQGNLSVEWFNPQTGQATQQGNVTGGNKRSFTAPFNGDAVLYLYMAQQATSTPTSPTATPTDTPTPEPTAISTSTPEPTETATPLPTPTEMPTPEPSPTSISTATPVSGPTILLAPVSARLAVGETFDTAVEVVEMSNLYGVDVRLTYDPNLLEVIDTNPDEPGVQVSLGSVFDGVDFLVVKNQAADGIIEFVATLQAPAPAFNGAGSLVNISWQGNNPGQTSVIFETVNLSDPDGQVLPITPQEGRLQVGTAVILSGRVQLQGKQDHSGVTIAAADRQVETDAEGRFEIETEEEYQLTADIPAYLSGRAEGNALALAVTADPFRVDLGTVTLLGGDVTDDDRIDIFDLAYIGSRYGGNDPGADINASGQVDIFDLAMAAGNYGQSGPVADWQ